MKNIEKTVIEQDYKPDLNLLQQQIENTNQTQLVNEVKSVIKSEKQIPNKQRAHQSGTQTYFHMNKSWSKDYKMLEIMKDWYPLKFKLPYPKHSNLDSNQQQEFMELNARFCKIADSSTETKNHKRYIVRLI